MARPMRISILAAALVFVPVVALASESSWQTVSPGVAVRLISGGEVDAAGAMLVGLEIDMPESTKTYWRVPGETGVPTTLDLESSRGITGYEIFWPYPTIDTASGYHDFVYYGPTILPLKVDVEGAEPTLALSVMLGICEDICVPVQTALSLPLDLTPDRANAVRLRQATATAPIAWDSPQPAFGAVQLDVRREAISIAIADPAIDPYSIIGAIGAGDPLLGAPEVDRATGHVLLPVLGKVDPAEMSGKAIDLVFMTDMGSFSLSQSIATP